MVSTTAAPALPAEDAWSAVLERGATLHLADGLQVRRALVMGNHRVELTGFTDGAVDQLKALGCHAEIIAWRLRLFLPMSERGPAVLRGVLERHPITRVIAGQTSVR